ncbi:hypothetical protein CPB83DRAFT_861205 [Crepidotus variabilis]|uniref:Uncharacterized protein n=1 Tax=Crepidotus variabilis TaxID=179855 RepID=A0A9P6E8R7_9AGAR|nr:hypothetical protein CPB83DRAFT_861205 [Crepidotus variabilis]
MAPLRPCRAVGLMSGLTSKGVRTTTAWGVTQAPEDAGKSWSLSLIGAGSESNSESLSRSLFAAELLFSWAASASDMI